MKESKSEPSIREQFDDIIMDIAEVFPQQIAMLAKAYPQQQAALFRFVVKRFDDIIMAEDLVNRPYEIARIAEVFPQQQEALFRLVVKRFDEIIMAQHRGNIPGEIAKLAEAFPQYSKVFALKPQQIKNYFKTISESEIRKSSRILAQGNRDDRESGFSLFRTLPEELCVKIAGLTRNSLDHDKKESEEIASSTFGRPKL